MDEGGIYEEGTPKEIFENPKKPNTIKFIKRLTSLTYKIETDDYNFTEAYDELQQYAEKLLIENERISDLQIALEEIVVNNIMESTEHPDVLVRVDYSEKHDILTLTIRYKGEHHDPKDSDNELFLEMLEEPTTEMIDRIIQSEDDVYNNFIWPTPTEQQKAKIEQTAQAILDARALYPDSSLADLYDELTMPPELRKAHQANDRAVMDAYGFIKGTAARTSESACVTELMKLYQKKVSAAQSK